MSLAKETVVLTEVRGDARWTLELEGPTATLCGGDEASPVRVPFDHARIGADCGLSTRGDTCTITLPTKGVGSDAPAGAGGLRVFRCSVNALQPFLAWIRLDLAAYERARLSRELRWSVPLGVVWCVLGSPLLGRLSSWLIGYGVGLIALGVLGRFRPHRSLLLADAALWALLGAQNARQAIDKTGIFAVVMTLFCFSFAMRKLREYAFHRSLANQK